MLNYRANKTKIYPQTASTGKRKKSERRRAIMQAKRWQTEANHGLSRHLFPLFKPQAR
jgi:hypothetical protein